MTAAVQALELVLDALAAEAPEAVARGRLALGRALGWTARTGWPEVAWRFSDLAGGVPLELVWRPGRPGLFWTAEPAAPELSPRRRLSRALVLLRTMGADLALPDRILAREAIRTDVPWPVWVSGRHEAAGDAAKLYALIRAIPGSLVPAAALLRAGDQPAMLGLTATGGREVYWTRPGRQPGDLWRMLADPGIAPLARLLDAALRDWTGSGLDGADDDRLGLSLGFDAAGQPLALAAFLRLRLAGGADRVRARLLAAGGAANPALARLWQEGRLRPMLLTLGASARGVAPALGLQLVV